MQFASWARRPVFALVPLIAFACTDDALAPKPEPAGIRPSAALSAGTLTLENERAFNSLAKSSRDDAGAETWRTTEYRSPRLTIVAAADAPTSAPNVAQALLPKGMTGGTDPVRALAEFDAEARTVSVDLWSQLSSNWQGPRKAASVIFSLNANGSRSLSFEAKGEGSAPLVPAVSIWNSPDSRERLLPNVVADAQVVRGQWQHWRVTVRVNTIGQKDGLIAVALNGTTVLKYEDVEIRGSGQDSFDQLDWKPKWGGSGDVVAADMTMRWDHIRLSTSAERIAVDGSTGTETGPDSSAAAAPSPTAVASVVVSPDSASAAVGGTQQFAATARDGAGDPIERAPMTWTSSDTTVATVSPTGLVTARKLGLALIVAASGTPADTARLIVSGSTSPGSTTDGGTPRAGHYVATNGSSGNAGTYSSPWDLATALNGAGGRIKPGDTLWVRGGEYRATHWVSEITGTSSAPVVVRAYPGERAALVSNSLSNSALKVGGQWAWYWGLEVYNENPNRTADRPNCVYPSQPNNKFINLIMHDCSVGMSFSNESRNSEVYGSIIYNNGWADSERSHGHGIYTKNDGAIRKLVRENIVFNQMRVGLQIFTESGSGQLKGFLVEGNVFFNNGVLTGTNTSATNMLLGGKEVIDDVDIRDNYTYYSPGLDQRSVRIGYGNELVNGRLAFDRNYIVGNGPLLEISDFSQLTLTNNQLIGSGDIVDLTDPTRSSWSWSGNLHHRDATTTAWLNNGSRYAFANWVSNTGLGSGDRTQGRPTATKVVVRKNEYEAGRGHVIVYNWGKLGSVSADLSGVLNSGDRFEVRNVQDLWGTPVASGTYSGGSITLPMTGVAPPRPIGDVPNQPVRTGPDFDVFVVVRK